jgi:hypothetical protein
MRGLKEDAMPDDFDPYYKWLGIRPEDQPPNHYRLLGIELFESDPEVIEAAAQQRIAYVKTYQLGKHLAVCQRILNEIAEAKACLLDVRTKADYDRQLPQQLGVQEGQRLATLVETDVLSVLSTSAPLVEDDASITTPPLPSIARPIPPPSLALPSWQILAAIGGGAVFGLVILVIAVILLSGGESPEAAQPDGSLPAASGAIATEASQTHPKEAAPLEQPETASGDQPATAEPAQASAANAQPATSKRETSPKETLDRLKKDLAAATSSADFKTVAEEGLALLEQTAAGGTSDVSPEAGSLALSAARKSQDYQLVRRVTLSILERSDRAPPSSAKPEKK